MHIYKFALIKKLQTEVSTHFAVPPDTNTVFVFDLSKKNKIFDFVFLNRFILNICF